MILVHYSKEPLELRECCYIQEVDHKPHGLWVSCEHLKDDHNWLDWCTSEEFRLEHLKYRQEIKLKPAARILTLSTLWGLSWFTREYSRDRIPGVHCKMFIDWPQVARDWNGIIIAPYQWECRLNPSYFWYYSWDCSSGCIWNLDIICRGTD